MGLTIPVARAGKAGTPDLSVYAIGSVRVLFTRY